MDRYFLILAILATITDQKKLPTNPNIIDLVDELLKNGGKWILAAAGSTGDQPPSKSCVEVTVTDTGSHSVCILVAHNHKIHKVKIVRIVGVNERNETEIQAKAPIHQYMIKEQNDTRVNKELGNEVNWDAAINSPMCGNSKTHKIRNTRFIITPIDKTTDHLYLVAVSTRSPFPEYQVAILTKTKLRRRYLEKMIKMINYKNFVQLEDVETPGLFSRHSLPRVQMKCADGFDMHDPYDTINHEILDMQFNKSSPPFPEKDFKTILVKHQ